MAIPDITSWDLKLGRHMGSEAVSTSFELGHDTVSRDPKAVSWDPTAVFWEFQGVTTFQLGPEAVLKVLISEGFRLELPHV